MTDKAILVIDMPSECNDEKCPLCYDFAMCSYLNRWIKDGKPNDCPLRPLPQKKGISLKEAIGIKCSCYSDGWNACLEEITGEKE